MERAYVGTQSRKLIQRVKLAATDSKGFDFKFFVQCMMNKKVVLVVHVAKTRYQKL